MEVSRDLAALARGGILSSEAAVRSFALNYFSGSFSLDLSVLPVALQAIAHYGVADAFTDYKWLSRLAQNKDSFGRLLMELRRINEYSADVPDYRRELQRAIVTGDPSSMANCLADDGSSLCLNEDVRCAIRDRVRLFGLKSAALWVEAEQFCESMNDTHQLCPSHEFFLHSLSDAIANLGRASDKKLSAVLREAFGGRDPWLEILGVMVLGNRRAEARARWLIPRLLDLHDLLVQRCMDSLIKIGGTSTIRGLTRYFPIANSSFQSKVAFVLGNIHSDESVRTCLRLLDEGIDPEVEICLLVALLRNLSIDGVWLARRFMRRNPQRNELLNVCQTAAKLLGV
jgi:hypothetical protein